MGIVVVVVGVPLWVAGEGRHRRVNSGGGGSCKQASSSLCLCRIQMVVGSTTAVPYAGFVLVVDGGVVVVVADVVIIVIMTFASRWCKY